MLIGPQNLKAPLSRIHAQITHAAEAAGRNPASVTLVAVTKDKAAEYVRASATLGVTDFGENYVKESLGKMDELESLPVTWHFIGALQSNKTRPVAERFAWVHSLDRMSVARRLSEQRPFHAPALKVCLQVALVDEPAKGGVEPAALAELAHAVAALPRLELRGLMCLPPSLPDESSQRAMFARLRRHLEELNSQGLGLDTLSMGMSADFQAAIAEGATHVRIGTALFGSR